MTTTRLDKAREFIRTHLGATRERTLALTDLSDDELTAQFSPLMSPMVWDMAHIAKYEELWLVRALGGAPVAPEHDRMYDAFENPRADRPSLPLLGPDEARAYLSQVRDATLELLEPGAAEPDDPRLLDDDFVYRMVIQHEHMHDETLLATRQLMGEAAAPPPGAQPTAADLDRDVNPEIFSEVIIPPGTYTVGVDRADEPWAFDNEAPAHDHDLDGFAIDATPVTNFAFTQFVADGGYADDASWTPAGRAWRDEQRLCAPQFWERCEQGRWWVQRFGRTVPLDPREPVQHVCWYESDAYARWAGKRLPTEIEWEVAASARSTGGRVGRPWGGGVREPVPANLGQRNDGPRPVGSHSGDISPMGCHGMLGDVWEWTSSDFEPYPGFEAFPYREYSEVFWGDGYKVLRGGSWATDVVASRTTFRNWDLPIRRQIFAGFRCARDLS